jgi:hypothetical protein
VREYVAVRSFPVLFNSALLKRDALTFNRIAIPGVEALSASDLLTALKRNNELEWLLEQRIVFEPDNSDRELWKNILSEEAGDPFRQRIREFREAMKETYGKELARMLTKEEMVDVDDDVIEIIEILLDTFLLTERQLRPISILLRKSLPIDAYPVFSIRAEFFQSPQVAKNDVIQIVLNELPVPDDLTPWEQILEYRSDPDSHSKFLALRHWMSEVARAKLTPAEVEEKLEYLLDQYQKHMNLHRMKTNVGTLETVVATGAEVLGDLVSFKWGKAAKALFSLKHRQVTLLEGELTAPGNEVAYIVKARETFKGK